MAIILEHNNELILKCKNAIWGAIYECMMKLNKSEQIQFTKNVSRLLNLLNQEEYGLGLVGEDLSNFLLTKEDWRNFSVVLEKALNLWVEETPDLPKSYKDWMWDFHRKVEGIAASFPGKN